MIVIGVVALAGIVLGALALFPRTGTVLVAAAGPNNLPLPSAQVLVDEKAVCESVPCRIQELSSGAHVIQVVAKGYRPSAGKPVLVQAGQDAVVNLELTPVAPASLEAKPDAKGLRLEVDGKDFGPTPTRISGLPPGEHTARLVGSPYYEPYQQTVKLESDRVFTWAPTLVPKKAKLLVQAGSGSWGAVIDLIDEDGQEQRIANLPAHVEVNPTKTYRLRASKVGYRDSETEVTFTNGEVEKRVTVALAAGTSGKGAAPSGEGPTPSNGKPPSGNTGTLAINSIPISSVILDGRPVGQTPLRIPASVGAHSLVFIHPEHGRKSLQVNVAAGQTAVAAMRF